MKRLQIILLLLIGNYSYGQLVVNTSPTATQMVQSFIGGGVTVSNIVYTGGAASRGSFSNGNTTNLGLTNGILLCTGSATAIINPASFLMSTNLGLAGDAALNNINNGCLTYDASILEFDFVPVSDSIKFKYVFGSEEYPNYICSQYNDVFAFFITGANPAGGNYNNFNMALVPGTNIPVSVNSINSGTPGSGYSSGGCLSLGYSNYFVNNAALAGTTIAFGGFTKPLYAKCKVVPCNTYHLKMAVADGYNGLYDSGVFLAANSFTSNTFTVSNYYTGSVSGNSAVEGCIDGMVSFVSPIPVTSPLVINYTISGTASNGTDYTTLPTSVTIPAGQDSIGLIIHPISDGITEGNETVILSIINGCVTIKDTILISDHVNISVNVGNDVSVCAGDSTTLTAIPTGGVLPLSYVWSAGAGNLNPVTVSPAGTTNYVVTVIDYCASSATDNVVVTVNPIVTPTANAAPSSICSGESTVITAIGADTYAWMPGNLSGNSVTVSPAASTIYSLTGTSTGGCTGTTSVSVTVNVISPLSATASPAAICVGQSSTLSAVGANSYTWMPGNLSGSTVTVSPLTSTTYTFTGSFAGGCTSSAIVSVSVNTMSTFLAVSSSNVICNGQSTTLTASGADTYLWMPGSLTGSTVNVSPSLSTTYTVIGTSTGGCTAADSVNITVNSVPIVTINASPNLICNGQTTVITATGGANYLWSPGGETIASITVTTSSTTNYIVTVSSGAGCSASASTTITVTTFPVDVNSTNENCGHANGTATAIASGICGSNYTYNWSTIPVQNNQTASNLAAGNYTVSVSCGVCSSMASVSIANDPGPNANFIATPQVITIENPTVDFTDVTSGNINAWYWNLGDGASSINSTLQHTYTQVGSYDVMLVVVDNNGCSDSVIKTIIVHDYTTLYIPNTFTPNDDGNNDVFTPRGINIDADNFEMLIYDRWGELVYQTKKWLVTSCEGWNGTKNNSGTSEKAVTGIYTYRIYAGNAISRYKVYVGTVTLIQ